MKTNLTLTTSKATARMIVLAVMLLSGVGMFGQNVTPTQVVVSLEHTVAADETVAATTATAAANASMNMVSWFMGTKQTPNANNSAESTLSSKKQLINSGTAPNRLLIKAFLKKAANYNSTIA